MKNEIMKFDTPELQVIEKSKAEKIKATFEPMAKMLLEFEKAFKEVTSEAEKEITKDVTIKAKRLRIDIGKVRINTEKARIAEKEEYLRAGKAIDGVSNILKWAVIDKENKLKEIEDHFELQETRRLEKLQVERVGKLLKYVEDAEDRNLSGMENDVWQAYFTTKKKEYDDRIATEKQAEIDRIAKEKAEAAERVRIRKENELLKKEAEEKEKQRRKDAAKAEAERKALEEKARKEREASEAKLRIEREAKAKLEAELKAKAEADEKAKREERERIEAELKAKKQAERKAKAAPDKAKLIEFAKVIDRLVYPELRSEDAQQILSNTKDLLNKVTNFIHEKTSKI